MEFFADAKLADRTEGVHRVLGTPVKLDAPIVKPERPWERLGVQACYAVHYCPEKKRYRLWYGASAGAQVQIGDQSKIDSSERRKRDVVHHICYAESTDGVNWERPELGLFEFQGSRANNIVCPGSSDSPLANILYDPNDPDPAKRYKAIGYGGGKSSILATKSQVGVSVSFSPDGLVWSEPVTIMDGANDLTDMDTVLPVREPTTGKWIGFFRPRTRPKRRFIGYAESTDFLHWTYPRMILCPDRNDTPWTEFYGLPASVIGGRRVGLLWIFHNHPEHAVMTNELVYSRFGFEYERVMPRQEFLPLGPDGSFDSRCVWPTRLVETNDGILIYYNARNIEHGSDRIDAVTPGEMQPGRLDPEATEPSNTIGLARLPWGHFCGLRADHEGMVETRWLDNYGSGGTVIAAKIEPGGYIRAGIHDVYGLPMAGYEPGSSRLEPGPHGTFRIVWGDGREGRYGESNGANKTVGHVLKLRFELYRATLFGVGIGEEGASPEYSMA